MKKLFSKKLYLLIIILFAFLLSGCDAKNISPSKIEKVKKQGFYNLTLNDKELKLEIANDASSRTKGLSQREELCENCGMIFLFDKKSIYDFWMKDMKFPLDIIYLDGNKITEIFRSVPIMTNDKTTVINPKLEADKVLELSAGWADKNGLKEGQILTF